MDIADLDDRDRKNIYKPTADNVHVVEATVRDIEDLLDVRPLDDALEEELEKAVQQLKTHNEDRTFVILKIVR